MVHRFVMELTSLIFRSKKEFYQTDGAITWSMILSLILRREKRKWETENIPLYGTLLTGIFQIRKISNPLMLIGNCRRPNMPGIVRCKPPMFQSPAPIAAILLLAVRCCDEKQGIKKFMNSYK